MAITFERPTSSELRHERDQALRSVGMSYQELHDLARSYMLTAEEAEAWEEVQRIDFLLGDG